MNDNRIPLAHLAEYFMAEQRARHAAILAQTLLDIEGFDAEDAIKRMLVTKVRALLTADLDRCEREITALVARGLRTDETVH